MASVQLSQRLKDDIVNNFSAELGKAYRKKYDVEQALQTVIQTLENSSDYLQDLIALEKQYQLILPDLRNVYDIQTHTYGSIRDHILSPNKHIGIVCNPKRAEEDNFTVIGNWAVPFTDEHSNERESVNWVEGDVAIRIENLNYYYPKNLELTYYSGWREQGPYAPRSVGHVLILSDPELCAAFSPIGEIEDRIGRETAAFKEALDIKNTLKQFLDDVPGGSSLVPKEDLQRMSAKPKPRTATKSIVDTIPEELKESMNEVLLTNKLLGD
tara:strand:+ start:35 stop:844 length:810 start_codon:yes stop_codon:yes gene_type:complete